MPYTQPPTRSSANQVISADWNTYVRENFIELEARKETDYVEVTASVSVTATTAATATTIITANAFTPNGTDVYRIEFECPAVSVPANAAGNAAIFHLYDNATNLGRIGGIGTPSNIGIDDGVRFSRRFTPSNASHTYSVRAHRTTANCTANAGIGGADVYFPISLRVVRLP